MKAPILALAASLSLHAVAAGQTVDQSYTVAPNTGRNTAFGPYGQSFTPAANSLDFVRLNLGDTGTNGTGGTYQVRVRQGSGQSGSVLGTSSSLALPDGFDGPGFGGGIAQFDFATAIALTSGNPYTLELQRVAGDEFFVYSNDAGGYSGGTAFAGGSPLTGEDLYFQTGFTPVPEPSGVLLVGGAAAGVVAVVRRRRASGRSADQQPAEPGAAADAAPKAGPRC